MIDLKEQKGGLGLIAAAEQAGGLNEGVLEDSILPEDIGKLLEQLESSDGVNDDLTGGDLSAATSDETEDSTEDSELDLSAGNPDKMFDPVRAYMREMGRVPLLTREQEVSIAKRIEAGLRRARRTMARGKPVAPGPRRNFCREIRVLLKENG